MKENFKNFIKRAQANKLSETEKDVLRSKILEFISFNPIRGKMPIVRDRNYISIFEVKYFMKAASLALICVLVVGGSGVSYVAAKALPGEALYAVKININENIEETLATTPKAKLAVQSEHIQRRLDEVQTLRKENKLSSETQNIVISKLDEHTASASKSIDQLREEGDVSAVLEATSSLTPIFEANKDILEKENNKSDLENEVDDTATLIAKIDDSSKMFQDQENSVIASVDEDATDETVAMSTSETIVPDPTLLAQEKTNEATNKAEREVKELSNQIHEIVKERIDTAKEKIRQIKREIAEEEAAIKNIEPEPSISVPVIPEIIIEEKTTSTEKVEVMSTLPKPEIKSSDTQIPTAKIEAPVAEEPVTPVATETLVDEFDILGKIKLAEFEIKNAEKLLKEGRFKEALVIAQEVNHLAGEIETHKRLKNLDLAKKENVNKTQKAEIAESIKN